MFFQTLLQLGSPSGASLGGLCVAVTLFVCLEERVAYRFLYTGICLDIHCQVWPLIVGQHKKLWRCSWSGRLGPSLLPAFCSVPCLVSVIILLPLRPAGAWGDLRQCCHTHLTTPLHPRGLLLNVNSCAREGGPGILFMESTAFLFLSLSPWLSFPLARDREVPLWTKSHNDMVGERAC